VTDDTQALDERLHQLAAEERRGLVLFLRTLDRFDEARGWARLGFGSLFDYLTRSLLLCDATAWRRQNAVLLLRRFPQLEAPLGDGSLKLSQLAALGKIMTCENADALIRRACHLSRRKTEELVASVQPRATPVEGIRKLPVPAARPVTSPPPAPDLPGAPPAPALSPVNARPGVALPRDPAAAPSGVPPTGSGESPRSSTPTSQSSPPASSLQASPSGAAPARPPEPQPEPCSRSRSRPTLEPVAAGRWSLRVTLDAAQKEKLDTLRTLLSHKLPRGDLNALLDEMLDCALEKHGKRRGTVKPPRARKAARPRAPTPGRRAPIPAAVRREVMERDGHRCTYVSPDGRRCESTWQLELHHERPAPLTGSSTPADLVVRCRVHNALHAVEHYGREHVDRRIRESRARREAERARRSASSGGS
jgi:5-methylcytosine-specific restriction endonuclease McrA